MVIELHQQSASATSGTSLNEFEIRCGQAAVDQRAVNWWIGDLALAVERQHPSTFHQAWPVWMSPDHIERCKAVAAAYPPEDRNIDATWTIHMQHSKQPDRLARVQAHVDAGHTSDEARKTPVTVEPEPVVETPAEQPEAAPVAAPAKTPWLLAVDVNGFICAHFFAGAGVQTATQFDQWLTKLIKRLQEKNLTDVVCCMDSSSNFRKELTKDWEHPYKESRIEKDPVLVTQLQRAPELLKERGLSVVYIDRHEADDVIASYATQFDGRVTILSADKDMRQCLSAKCNLLKDVGWEDNPETGSSVPTYQWVTAKSHIEDGMPYSGAVIKGITPEQWPHFQAIAGDSGDNIKGVEGIGAKGAMDLILAHETVQGVLQAFKEGTLAIKLNKKQVPGMESFEPIADVMLQLTTLKTDLSVPMVTRLAMKETP